MKTVQKQIKMVRIRTKVRIRIKIIRNRKKVYSLLFAVTRAGFNITWKRSAFLSRQRPSSIPSS
jgi:hypothetical protein